MCAGQRRHRHCQRAGAPTDLYWALRGGTGGNWRVVLQVTYRMRLDQVWAWAISWDAVHAAQVLPR